MKIAKNNSIIRSLIPILLLSSGSMADAAITVSKVHDLTSSTTQDYTFTEAGVGSITLRAVYTATNAGAASGAFTSLDGGDHVGNSANSAADRNNHFTGVGADSEGFTVSVTLLSADPGIDTSSIAFSFDSLGVRELGLPDDAMFTWLSSSTTTVSTTNPVGEALETLDSSSYGDIANNAYTGTFTTTAGFLQLSDTVSGGNGVVMTATFATVVPEPSSFALFGIGGLALLFRRRK